MVELSRSISGGTEAEILDFLKEAYPGKILFSIDEVARIRGVARGTQYNQLSSGTSPVRFSKKGGKPKALIFDVAKGLARDYA